MLSNRNKSCIKPYCKTHTNSDWPELWFWYSTCVGTEYGTTRIMSNIYGWVRQMLWFFFKMNMDRYVRYVDCQNNLEGSERDKGSSFSAFFLRTLFLSKYMMILSVFYGTFDCEAKFNDKWSYVYTYIHSYVVEILYALENIL